MLCVYSLAFEMCAFDALIFKQSKIAYIAKFNTFFELKNCIDWAITLLTDAKLYARTTKVVSVENSKRNKKNNKRNVRDASLQAYRCQMMSDAAFILCHLVYYNYNSWSCLAVKSVALNFKVSNSGFCSKSSAIVRCERTTHSLFFVLFFARAHAWIAFCFFFSLKDSQTIGSRNKSKQIKMKKNKTISSKRRRICTYFCHARVCENHSTENA